MEKISIILPVYNVEDYIEECLDSILKQTYSNIEVILIDDGAKDKSGEICDRYAQKDDRVKVLHKKNAGVSAARNSGIEMATGDYITFVDPDDWIDSDTIEKMLEAIKKENADISFCRFKIDIIPEDKRQFYQPADALSSNGKDAVGIMIRRLAYGTMVWNKMFKREMIINASDNSYVKFDETLKCGEDQVWLIKVIQKANKVSYLADELYYWRVRENSAFRDEKITDTKINDIVAQEMSLDLIEDKESDAYVLIMERMNYKIYNFKTSAYINGQKEYVKQLEEYSKKYSKYWYSSNRIAWQTKAKRLFIEACIKLNVSRDVVNKVFEM